MHGKKCAKCGKAKRKSCPKCSGKGGKKKSY